MKTIIFTISNAPGTVYMFNSFRKNGYRVIGCDANPDAVGQFFSDAFYIVPWQNDPGYTKALLEIVKKEKADILKAGESEAPMLIASREKFNELGCTLVATDFNTLDIALDKVKLFTYLQKNTDIPLPGFHAVENLEDFDNGMKKLKSLNKCIKPARTSGSRGFVILKDEIMQADHLFSRKGGFVEMTIDHFRKILKTSSNIPKLILMDYLEDANYDSSLVCKDGKILFQSIRTREEVKIGTITKGKIVKNKELNEINIKIAESLQTTGLISTQFIGNKLIEINPRWSTTLIYKSINEYIMGVQLFTGEKISINQEDLSEYSGVKMLRYWDVLTYKDGIGLVE